MANTNMFDQETALKLENPDFAMQADQETLKDLIMRMANSIKFQQLTPDGSFEVYAANDVFAPLGSSWKDDVYIVSKTSELVYGYQPRYDEGRRAHFGEITFWLRVGLHLYNFHYLEGYDIQVTVVDVKSPDKV